MDHAATTCTPRASQAATLSPQPVPATASVGIYQCKIVTEPLPPQSAMQQHTTSQNTCETSLKDYHAEKALDQSPPPQRMPSAPYAEGPPRPAPGASALRAGLRPDAGTERGCDMARRSAASAAWRRACASRIGSEE